ncbi:MAG: cold-shock protein [Chloroflexi bacterium]|nr:cold-shock protein [Chloroflexota bacterium]
MAQGVVAKLIIDRGFGFLTEEDGKELFFHRSEVAPPGFEALHEGQQVSYERNVDPRRNRPQAVKVVAL